MEAVAEAGFAEGGHMWPVSVLIVATSSDEKTGWEHCRPWDRKARLLWGHVEGPTQQPKLVTVWRWTCCVTPNFRKRQEADILESTPGMAGWLSWLSV